MDIQCSEFVAISDYQKRTDNTIALFKWLDAHHSEQLKITKIVFERALLKQKEYDLLARYIRPKLDYANDLSSYLASLEYEKSKADFDENESFATKTFINSVATLVALLVKSDRNTEALDIVQRAKIDLDNEKLQSALDAAQQGNLPEPLF